MSRRSKGDWILGIVLLVVSGAYYTASLSLPAEPGQPGPAFLPRLLAIGLGITALWLLASSAIARRRSREETGDDASSPRAALAAIGLSIFFVALFELIGWWLATLGYVLGLALLFGVKRPLQLALIPGVATGLIYLLFVVLLGSRLPVPW